MVTRSRRWLWLSVLALGVGFGSVGCAEYFPQSTLRPMTEFTEKIDNLFSLIVILAAAVWVVVNGVLVYSLVKFRAKPGDPLPPQTHGNTTLEIAWTIAPAIILAIIAVPTVQTIFEIAEPPPETNIHINVVGKQWWWEYQYREHGIVTANELHVPVGQTVALDLTSTDVIHAYWIPRLAAKRDNIPGRTNVIWFTAREPGEYIGQCAEYCGTSHANMRLKVFVDDQATFDAWVQRQKAAAPQPTDPVAQRGFQVVTTGACAGCHTIQGTTAQGRTGPALTDFGNRTTVATIAPNTKENLKAWIRNPQEFKPGALMPNLNLSDEDLEAVSTYLLSLK